MNIFLVCSLKVSYLGYINSFSNKISKLIFLLSKKFQQINEYILITIIIFLYGFERGRFDKLGVHLLNHIFTRRRSHDSHNSFHMTLVDMTYFLINEFN